MDPLTQSCSGRRPCAKGGETRGHNVAYVDLHQKVKDEVEKRLLEAEAFPESNISLLEPDGEQRGPWRQS